MNHHPKKFGRVAVLMGGFTEREVSLNSGRLVLAALEKNNIDCIALDYQGPEIVAQLIEAKVDRVFNILHGGSGEGGDIQGLLTTLNLPYTDSSMSASALAMNKYVSKLIFRHHDLPIPDFCLLTPDTDPKDLLHQFGLPLIVKPVDCGSSVGVTIVHDADYLVIAIAEAYCHSREVLVEKLIEGHDITVGILDNQALPIIEIIPDDAFYDYHAKYHADNTQYICPAKLTPEQTRRIQADALKAFHALRCEKWGRVDFMLDHFGRAWLLEVNTVPGMTDHSLVPIAAKTIGLSYDELILKILAMTLT